MSPLRMIYLGLAVWGAVHPMTLVFRWFGTEGFDPRGLITLWFTDPASSGLAWDLAIAATALTVWVLAETRVRRNWSALIAIPATFFIGLSCGLPLYLFLRTRKVA